MIRSVPPPCLAENGPLRTEEDQCFWKALVDLAAMENANQAEMAAFVGVSQGYVSKILAGKQAPKPALRRRFAAFFKLSYEDMVALGRERLESQAYVSEGAGAKRYHVRDPLYGGDAAGRPQASATDFAALKSLLRDLRAREVHQASYTEVPLREATGSMGGGSTETGDRALTYLSFRTDWIRSKGNPEYMTVIRAFGDSMEPTIPDGSVVLIDEGRRQFVKNKVYYLRYNGQMYIKRLVERDGRLAIASDNDPNLLLVSDADDFEIIGRCIWSARELD
ncbi:putative phage repressor [Solidesulfovibrio carbinoliphilus subsp. oakridgensis]|uniref:Phage repressor n=1 Tax=Solidesulfovibrio carbinoliphilus subsp. oakridgensis TaxID=694327 RepID=G7Q6Z4_9BACT|nr:XRE family transcriptional regulator [Solidesulfovibrio carbinoliphilus]EHJ48477.1 putative phage repressor [Solidesulfovibrio carbinoliphilus subsp. oakridgensis]